MKLKNKYSKQNIYNNQKFEDQIWYNQQIMIFLIFSQLPESVFRPNFFVQIFQENSFLKTMSNFSLTGKCFLLNNFFNAKQTQNTVRRKITFRKTNTVRRKKTFLKIKSNFYLIEKYFLLTRKCFLLTNFFNNK